MAAEAALSLGSNVGDSLAALRRAVQLISERIGAVTSKSGVYETAPWGMADQPNFLNVCVIAATDLTPLGLLDTAKAIERETGRVERARWGPREIDIDIIFYDDLVLNDQRLKIPHPLMEMRGFVMIPLLEIAPGWKHPAYGWTVAEFVRGMDADGVVAARLE
ncbi:MAG: 2-amino-4-hydroxy-6-hydroxymethyldihydropteridine diphosphokinase [Synergistaceae bacterium]|nr:2-amino-4-hydroxy-6-hydroxymethyldihydropteridine diphosphokinase [Synergistaceae bacterium]